MNNKHKMYEIEAILGNLVRNLERSWSTIVPAKVKARFKDEHYFRALTALQELQEAMHFERVRFYEKETKK